MRWKILFLFVVGFFIEAYSQNCNCDRRQTFQTTNFENSGPECRQGNNFACLQNQQGPVGSGTSVNCGQCSRNIGQNQGAFLQQSQILGVNAPNKNCNPIQEITQENFRPFSNNIRSNQCDCGQQERFGNSQGFFGNLKVDGCDCQGNPYQSSQVVINTRPTQDNFGQKGPTSCQECRKVPNLGCNQADNTINLPLGTSISLTPNQNQCGCNNQNIGPRPVSEPCGPKCIGINKPFFENIRSQSSGLPLGSVNTLQSNNFGKPCQNTLDNCQRPALAQDVNLNNFLKNTPVQPFPSISPDTCEKSPLQSRAFQPLSCENIPLQTSTAQSQASLQNLALQSQPTAKSASFESGPLTLTPSLSIGNFNPLESQGITVFSPTCGSGQLQIQPSLSIGPCQNNRQGGSSFGFTGGPLQFSKPCLPNNANKACSDPCSGSVETIQGPIISTTTCEPQFNIPDIKIPFPSVIRSFNNENILPTQCGSNTAQNMLPSSINTVNGLYGSVGPLILDKAFAPSNPIFDRSINPSSILFNNNIRTGFTEAPCNGPNVPAVSFPEAFSRVGAIESSPGCLVSGPFISGSALAKTSVSPVELLPVFTPPRLQISQPGVTTSIITPPSMIPTQIVHTTVVDNSVANTLANALNLLIMSDAIQSKNHFEHSNGIDLVSGVEVNPYTVNQNFLEGVTEVVTPLAIAPTLPSVPVLPETFNSGFNSIPETFNPSSNEFPGPITTQILNVAPSEAKLLNAPLNPFPEPLPPQNINYVVPDIIPNTPLNALPFPVQGAFEPSNVPPEAVNFFSLYNELPPFNPFPEPFPIPLVSPVASMYGSFPSSNFISVPELNFNPLPNFSLPDFTFDFSTPSFPSATINPLQYMDIQVPSLNMEIPELYAELSVPFSSCDFLNGAIENTNPIAAEILLPSSIPAQLKCSLGFTSSSQPVVSVDAIEI